MALQGPKPAFTQPGYDIDVLLGEQFQLDCRVKNAEKHVIMWRRGPTLVSFAQTMASPSTRMAVNANHTLTVSNANWSDSGVFECGVGSLRNFTQASTVNVMGPTTPVKLPADETDREVAWNSTVVLRCPATGRPQPRVKWLKRGVRGVLNTGPNLTIREARRHHSGTYVCVLFNGIGSRIVQRIKVKVQYPPEIQCADESKPDWKRGTIQVSIVCTADALPAVHLVSWTVPGNSLGPIRLDSRSESTTVGRYLGRASSDFARIEFVIANFTHHDLGTYTIWVNNSVAGTAVKHNVTSNAQPVVFTSPDESPSETAFNVSFRYKSHLPPLEIRVMYRNHHSDGPLNLVYDSQGLLVSPGFGEKSVNTYAVKKKWQGAEAGLNGWIEKEVKRPRLQETYTVSLLGLEPASAYEVFVQLRNKEGWNAVEEPFQFSTKGMMLVKRQHQQQLLAHDAVEAATSSGSRSGASLARLALGFLLMAL
ncbi:neurotrimin-like [Thrips palmi]|uniref:Neurotrimin-like n=1 Tax=Thrips palmi TaxID=161013 RepID=A0A6P8ZBA3_THRPL|nr:neurotrimin-like [Thrips palmi]